MFGTIAIAAALKTKQNDHVKMNFFLAKFCYCVLQCPSVHSHPRKADCGHRREAAPGEGQGGSCSKGNTWLVAGLQCCSSGLRALASSLLCCGQQLRQRSSIHTEYICQGYQTRRYWFPACAEVCTETAPQTRALDNSLVQWNWSQGGSRLDLVLILFWFCPCFFKTILFLTRRFAWDSDCH